jgi:hypothetical protein
MAAPFQVEGATPGTQVWSVDAAGNTVQSGALACSTVSAASLVAGTQGASVVTGIQTFSAGGGDNTNAAAVYLNGTIGAGAAAILGTAATGTQLSDTTRDYMVYIGVTAGGAAATLSIGAANTAVATLYAAATCGVGSQYAFRLPAGWYIRFQGTAGITQQTAISC